MKQNIVPIEDYWPNAPKTLNGFVPIELQEWIETTHKSRPIDVNKTPCDEALLKIFDVIKCCEIGVVPWQKFGSQYVILFNDISQQQALHDLYPQLAKTLTFAKASQRDINHELRRMGRSDFLDNAHKICPPQNSVRTLGMDKGKYLAVFTSIVFAALLYFYPTLSMGFLITIATLSIFGNSILRLVALIHISRQSRIPQEIETTNLDTPKNGWPSITVLIPLFRESEVLHSLLENLIAIDYPTDKLDIKLLIENDDKMTSDALAEINLPSYFDVVFIPEDNLRTKPKAMNYTLPFCHSDIIGIYDAEDKPDVMQLRKVAHKFAQSPDDVACVQCELDFFNTRQNWFTRCFTIEYRIWFAAVLPVVQHLGMAVPLGGTSVFIKRQMLKDIGAWDAHNVTEDADLGVRVKRNGYQTVVVHSRTMEEANSRGISWIRQRSRWLKGYMMTWLCHMRDPIGLYKDLGLIGFMGFHILFMGAIVSYLSLPIFWVMWLSVFGIDMFNIAQFGVAIHALFFTIMLFAQVINLSLAFMALRENHNTKSLFIWYFTMTIYWPLGAIAAYKAAIEVIFAPYYWDKTQHGHAKLESQLQ